MATSSHMRDSPSAQYRGAARSRQPSPLTSAHTCTNMCSHSDRLRPHPPPLAHERAGGTAARCSAGRWRWLPSRAGRRWSARSRAPRRRSGCGPGCVSPRRSRAVPGWRWSPADPVRAEAIWEDSLRRLEAIGAAVEPAAAGRGVLRRRPAARPLRRGRGGAGPSAAGGRAAGAARRRAEPALRSCGGGADARAAARRSPSRGSAARRLLAELPVRRAARPARRRVGRRERPGHARRGSASAPSASSRRCPPRRSPIASASRGCGRCGWRAASTSRFAPAARARSWWRESACPRRPRASSSSARWSCSSSGCSPTGGGPRGRSAGCGSRPGWPPAAAGAPRSCCAAPAPIPSGCDWCSPPGSASSPAPRPRSPCGRSSSGRRPAISRRWRTSPDEQRRGRLAEAVRQARAAAGRDAVLQVLEVDPDSRVPERRAILTPFPERDELGPRSTGRGRSRSTPATTACRARSPASRSRRCARTGWSRIAGGRRNPCKGATSRWSSPTAATSSSSASRADGERWFEQRA